jgi:hypothetical protein
VEDHIVPGVPATRRLIPLAPPSLISGAFGRGQNVLFSPDRFRDPEPEVLRFRLELRQPVFRRECPALQRNSMQDPWQDDRKSADG